MRSSRPLRLSDCAVKLSRCGPVAHLDSHSVLGSSLYAWLVGTNILTLTLPVARSVSLGVRRIQLALVSGYTKVLISSKSWFTPYCKFCIGSRRKVKVYRSLDPICPSCYCDVQISSILPGAVFAIAATAWLELILTSRRFCRVVGISSI